MDIYKDIQSNHVADMLNKLKGKDITLLLSNGMTISGTLAATEVNYASQLIRMVHLTKLQGQSFNDGAIPKETISGIIFRDPNQ